MYEHHQFFFSGTLVKNYKSFHSLFYSFIHFSWKYSRKLKLFFATTLKVFPVESKINIESFKSFLFKKKKTLKELKIKKRFCWAMYQSKLSSWEEKTTSEAVERLFTQAASIGLLTFTRQLIVQLSWPLKRTTPTCNNTVHKMSTLNAVQLHVRELLFVPNQWHSLIIINCCVH